LDNEQKQFYHRMLSRDRGYLFLKDGHIGAVTVFFIGDDDEKFLYKRVPWTVVDDDPKGTTVYIDQLVVKDHVANGYIHRELSLFLKWIKKNFPNVKRAKWVRANAMFRKHGIKEGESNVHVKSIR